MKNNSVRTLIIFNGESDTKVNEFNSKDEAWGFAKKNTFELMEEFSDHGFLLTFQKSIDSYLLEADGLIVEVTVY